MLPKIRLGKRSTLGALVSTTCPSEGGGHREGGGGGGGGVASVAMATRPGAVAMGKIKLHPGQKVYVHCGSHECPGVVEQHNHVDNQVSVFLPDLARHVLRKTEDVWTSPSAHLFLSLPSTSSLAPARTVSSCIDVPRKSAEKVDEVDMDEMMAAMVLTSLSFSPLLHSPKETPAALGVECAGGELSDSGSSGYWSVGHSNGSPAPSPPITEADGSLTMASDEGLDMELEQVLFEEPAQRKRKNSMKVAYRCLWPTCGKILSSVVGIKRHVRTLHLGSSGEHERCSRSEEDFYYTEIHQREQQAHTPHLAPLSFSSITPVPPSSSSLLPLASPPPNCTPLGDGAPPGPTGGQSGDGGPQASLLSKSAPSGSGNLWQVQSEHSYQAPPPATVASPASCSSASHCWTTSGSLHSKQGAGPPFRMRSVSVGEQWHQQQSAPSRTSPSGASPPRGHWPSRRVRGEAKKCRKVYGIEHKDQWCTACRWKKACQRFID